MKDMIHVGGWIAIIGWVAMMGGVSGDMSAGNAPSHVFNYRHSFRAPFFGGSVPFWEAHGSALVQEKSVQLTAAERSQQGSMWGNEPVYMVDWEVVVEFSMGGGGVHGADGLAFWYTQQKYALGNVFGGAPNDFQGLGVFLDSFDNVRQREMARVSVVLGKGAPYRPEVNGADIEVAYCERLFRNSESRLRVSYRRGRLDIALDVGRTGNWENCASTELRLPPRGYFGVSAATGGLFDRHEVLSFLAYDLDIAATRQARLTEPSSSPQQQQPPQENPASLNKEKPAEKENTLDSVKEKIEVKESSSSSSSSPPPAVDYLDDDAAPMGSRSVRRAAGRRGRSSSAAVRRAARINRLREEELELDDEDPSSMPSAAALQELEDSLQALEDGQAALSRAMHELVERGLERSDSRADEKAEGLGRMIQQVAESVRQLQTSVHNLPALEGKLQSSVSVCQNLKSEIASASTHAMEARQRVQNLEASVASSMGSLYWMAILSLLLNVLLLTLPACFFIASKRPGRSYHRSSGGII